MYSHLLNSSWYASFIAVGSCSSVNGLDKPQILFLEQKSHYNLPSMTAQLASLALKIFDHEMQLVDLGTEIFFAFGRWFSMSSSLFAFMLCSLKIYLSNFRE